MSNANFSVVAPQIAMTYPNGGETWYMGSRVTITWNAHASAGETVKPKLFRGDTLERWIIGSTPNDGSFVYILPTDLTPASNYRVQVYQSTDGSNMDYSDSVFSINASPLEVTHPNGGELLAPGDTVLVTWTSEGIAGSQVRIRLIENDEPVGWVAGVTANDGAHYWTVPSALSLGTQYKILVYSESNGSMVDYSDSTFSITEARLKLIRPQFGGRWIPGTSSTITWDRGSIAEDERVNLDLFKGGVLTTSIATNILNTCAFDWSLPGTLALGSDYRIRIQSVSTPELLDFTDGPFTMAAGTLNLTHPNGGERFVVGSPVSILWSQEGDAGATVDIALLKGGVLDRTLVAAENNDGRYVWNVPNDLAVGTDYTVQIASTDDAEIMDKSSRTFSVTNVGLRVTSPNGGETVAAGSPCSITWESTGALGTYIKIKLVQNGAVYGWITGKAINNGAYTWNVPADLAPGSYQILMYASADGTIKDTSDGVFSVTAP